MKERIFLASPHMSEEGYEAHYVKEAFETNWVAPLGPNVNGLEEELAAVVGIGHAAALSSGTAAIHMALCALGINKGDIVLCQTLTFVATVNPIIYQGAVPVFIDSDRETWNMDPVALESALDKYGERVKAVFLVRLTCLAPDRAPLLEICYAWVGRLTEDCAGRSGSPW